MSFKASLIYFMIGNYFNHKEIGSYINESNNINFSQRDLNEIIVSSRNIFNNLEQNNKKSKENFQNFIIYYILTDTNTFYLAALTKDFDGNREEDIFQLFEDIECQGIKKLTDKNGELSKIGKQNLKFCIEQSNKQKYKKNNSILSFFNMTKDKEQKSNTISLLSTQINDAHNSIDDGKNKLLNNTDDIGNFSKNNEKDLTLNAEGQKDINKRRKCRRISIILGFTLIISIIIFSIIFK